MNRRKKYLISEAKNVARKFRREINVRSDDSRCKNSHRRNKISSPFFVETESSWQKKNLTSRQYTRLFDARVF